MRIRLLGTGSADGLPNPFCTCATCEDARATGRTRASSSALVDDVILVDPGPNAGAATGRQGVHLGAVEHVLITHGHPDHLAPEFLMWRSWITGLPPVHLWGPAHALERCTHWIAPGADVTCHVVGAGDDVALATRAGDYRLRVIPSAHGHGNGDAYAEEAVLFDLTAPDGDRLLYATDTGPLLEPSVLALRDRAFDLVLIEETFGHRAKSAGHLNLATLASTLDQLRAAGAVTEATDVVAFHLGHHNPPAAQLAQELAALGARAVDDGTVLDLRRPRGHRELVIGGARSGKSHYAESVAARLGRVTYVATGGSRPEDPEWCARIATHRARRPEDWATVETTDIAPLLLASAPGQTLLVDCIGMWLTARLDAAGAWDAATASVALEAVHEEIDALVDAVRAAPARLVLVTNEVGQGVVPATASGRLFRDLLGIVNTRLADACDETTVMVAGRALTTRAVG